MPVLALLALVLLIYGLVRRDLTIALVALLIFLLVGGLVVVR